MAMSCKNPRMLKVISPVCTHTCPPPFPPQSHGSRANITRLGRTPPKNTSASLPFSDLVEVFEKLEEHRRSAPNNAKKSKARRLIISRFLRRWQLSVGPDVFPVMRLLMASHDNERRIQIMETSLAKIMCKIEGIGPKGKDYKDLQDWRTVDDGGNPARDFAEFCYRIMVKRSNKTGAGGMPIDDINKHLDELVSGDTGMRTESIKSVYLALPPKHFIWFVRIMLRKIHLNVQLADFWSAWNENAYDLFQVTSSLRFVCMAPDQNGNVDARHLLLGAGKCFRPQLAHEPVGGDTVDAFLRSSIDKLDVDGAVAARFPGCIVDNYFFIEEKFDGERMQVHISRVTGGKIMFKWWTRSGIDRTDLYGSHVPDAESGEAATGFTITRYLRNLVTRQSPFSIVLDGEVVAWDPLAERVLPFNDLMKVTRKQKARPSDTEPWPMFCAFDIVHLDCSLPAEYGQELEDMQGKSLYLRRENLKSALNYVPDHFEMVTAIHGRSLADLRQKFDQTMLDGGEGLILKNPYGLYRTGQRAGDWIKIKPNHVAELRGQPFKCVVVGANYGQGKNAGRMSSYLCAVAEDDNQKTFLTCIKVPCNGRREQELIASLTGEKWVEWDQAEPPTHLKLGRGSHERPDRWISPSDSVLVSVSCSEVFESNLYPTGKALRFPLLVCVHPDEDLTSGMTLADFEAHIDSGPAHLSRSR